MSDLPINRKLFVGIDPGQTGGMGIIDEKGQFVAAYRWDKRNPRRLYQILKALSKGNTENSLCQADNRLKNNNPVGREWPVVPGCRGSGVRGWFKEL
jgi:hypothetical protein